MARNADVALLTRDVYQWNGWIKGQVGYMPDFTGANLADMNLTGADLTGADFRGANLNRANLSKSWLNRANFGGANLTGANLDNCDLSNSSFTAADLHDATLIDSNLTSSNLRHAILIRANLQHASLIGVNFHSATFGDTVLRLANLKEADLQQATGLALDGNDITGARFSPDSTDLWSVLRRNYTGPMILFHLLFLLGFLVPYALKTASWLFVNRGQETIQHVTQFMRTSGDQIVEGHRSGGAVAAESDSTIQVSRREAELKVREELYNQLNRLSKLKPCLADDCVSIPIWKMMIGLDRGPIFSALAISLILYNLIRGFLTWKVGALREEEERSHYAPILHGRSGYLWLSKLHRFASVLLVINICSLAWHAWYWFSRTVSIPT